MVDEQADEFKEDGKQLEQFLQIQIETMDHCSLLQLEPCKTPQGRYMVDMNAVPEITDKVYARGKTYSI